MDGKRGRGCIGLVMHKRMHPSLRVHIGWNLDPPQVGAARISHWADPHRESRDLAPQEHRHNRCWEETVKGQRRAQRRGILGELARHGDGLIVGVWED